MSTYEFEDKLDEVKLVLIPTGSTEQHGPNMALETDTVIAHALSLLIAKELHPMAVSVPPVNYGVSLHHMGYKGTITLKPETFCSILEDICVSMKRHKETCFLFINGHSGNKDCLKLVCSKLRHTHGIKSASMFYFDLAADVIKERLKSSVYGHADEIEGSMAMYLGEKDLIKTSSMRSGENKPPIYPYISLSGEPGIFYPLVFEEKTYNGAQGSPEHASIETGKAICDVIVDRVREFAHGFVDISCV
jgi:creatinine amidohydrolase